MTNRVHATPTLLVLALAISAAAGEPARGQAGSYFTVPTVSYSPPPFTVLTSSPPIAGDFDNDGVPDVVTTMEAGPGGVIPNGWHIAFFHGTAAGMLVGPALSQAGFSVGARMRALDFNADGNLDVIVQAGGWGLVLYSGAGNGSFVTATWLYVTGPFEVGNLNGDAFPDLVTLSGAYTGNGSTFTLSQTFPVTGFPQDITLADVDGDAILDIVVVAGSTLQVRRGLGSAAFAPVVSIGTGVPVQPFGPLYTQTGTVAVGDVNHDGRDDIAFFGGTASASSVRLMLGSATTLLQPSTVIAPVVNGSELKIFDVDGDGNNDLVWQTFSAPFLIYPPVTASVVAALGNGAGGFSAPVTFTWGTVGYYPALLPVDLDGDGDRDLATVGVQGYFTDNGGITPTQVGVLPNRALAGTGAAGVSGTPVIGAGSVVVGNAAFAISVANAVPVQPMALGLASGPAMSWNGAGIGIDPATLLAFPGAPFGVAVTTSDALGMGSVPIPIPNAPALHGFTAYAQWIVVDSAGTFPFAGLSCSLSRRRTLIVQ